MRLGFIYVGVSDVQANGLIIVEAPEWSTTYGVDPKNLREVDMTHYTRQLLDTQRWIWTMRNAVHL